MEVALACINWHCESILLRCSFTSSHVENEYIAIHNTTKPSILTQIVGSFLSPRQSGSGDPTGSIWSCFQTCQRVGPCQRRDGSHALQKRLFAVWLGYVSVPGGKVPVQHPEPTQENIRCHLVHVFISEIDQRFRNWGLLGQAQMTWHKQPPQTEPSARQTDILMQTVLLKNTLAVSVSHSSYLGIFHHI